MQVRIKGYTFSLAAPFAEGHRLTTGEAQALNDLRAENIQNNFRSAVNEQVARVSDGSLLSQHILDALQAQLSEYDAKYRFIEKVGRNRLGDIEREIQTVALERAKAQGAELDQIPGLVEQFAQLPAVREEARARVAANKSALAGGMDSL